MNLILVTPGRSSRKFLNLPKFLYKNDPHWICPLDVEIEAIFDPARNVFFKHGDCCRWIIQNRQGLTIGRIAAFINTEKSHKNPQPTGGIGFFECTNDRKAAHLLFETALSWLKKNGMEAMDGPINFGENDKYWGLLVDGFKPPSLGMNYNPPYYIDLFESFGFEKLYDQYTNFLDATIPLPERFIKIADWVMKKPGYSFKHFDRLQAEKFFHDFLEIYNDAWTVFENYTPIEMETIRESFRQMKPILDEKIIWFAYYNEEPIATVVCIPDVNQILKHVNGKLNTWGKLKFAYYHKRRYVNRLRIILMGCKKRFHNHGIESALIRCLQREVLPRNTIKGVELAWVGDFNPKMISIHEATGARKD
ncbi:MAG TPA: hypothetical protein VM012_09580, partial [Flavitalea sp.]|nr:hypothetical protein [Flavitalea sp.]